MQHTDSTPGDVEQPHVEGFSAPLYEDDAPEEVEQDAVAELDRIHAGIQASMGQAPRNEFDDSYGMSGGVGAEEFDFDRPVMSRGSSATSYDRDPKTLEDLYAIYPDIGGQQHLRVVRKHPARWQGVRVAGWIEDVYHQISMSEFASKYGGNTYEVSVRGPSSSGSVGAERTLKTITINVPGPPKMPADLENSPMAMGVDAGRYNDHRVELKKLELEHADRIEQRKREDRMRERMERSNNLDTNTLKLIEQAAARESNLVRSVTERTIADLHKQNNRHEANLQAKEALIQELREKLMVTQSEAANRWREEESRQVRELKEHHSREIARIKEDHATKIQHMQSEHERRIEQMTGQQVRELQSLRDTEQRERERLRDDASRREKNLQDDYSRREQMYKEREQMLRDEFARREDTVRRDYELRFQQLERSSKRDIDIIKSSESTKAVLAEQTANNHIQLMQGEIGRLSQQLASAEAEAASIREELSRYTNKPLLQQVEETKIIGETLGLFDKKEEDLDWKKIAAKSVGDFFTGGGAAQVAEALSQTRTQNKQAVEMAKQRQAMMQRQQAMMRHQQPPLQLAPPPMATQQIAPTVAPSTTRPQRVAPPPMWDQSAGPPAPDEAKHVPPVPSGMPAPEPPPVYLGAKPSPEPTAPPISGPRMPEAVSPSIAVAPEINIEEPAATPTLGGSPFRAPSPSSMGVSSETPHSSKTAPQYESEEEDEEELTPEAITGFIEKLELAISSGLVSPAGFAERFVEEVGPVKTRQIISKIQPDQLIDTVAEARHPDTGELLAQNSAIITRSGRKYVHELWAKTQALVG